MSPQTDLQVSPSGIFKRVKDKIQACLDLKKKHDMQLAELGEPTDSYCYKSTLVKYHCPQTDELHATTDTEAFVNSWEVTNSQFRRLHERFKRLFQSPAVDVTFPNFRWTARVNDIYATWMGHSSVYMEFYWSGLTVLCDPVFEDTCVYRGVKERRLNPPPCKIEDIPFIDIVLISNSHPQHFSYRTIKKIHKIHPFCQFIVPRGCGDWFRENSIDTVTELDWYEKVDFQSLPYANASDTAQIVEAGWEERKDINATIWCLPCQYESPMGPGSRAKGLWAAWLIKSEMCNVYFCGYAPRILSGNYTHANISLTRATGYRTPEDVPPGTDPLFTRVAKRPYTNNRCPQELCRIIGSIRPCIDLACIPIGGYKPRTLWGGRNCDPTDAIMMLEDLGAQFGLAIGYGTWGTTNEESRAVEDEFERACVARGCESGKFNITGIGQTIGYPQTAARGPVDPQSLCENRPEWLKMKLREKRGYDPCCGSVPYRPRAQ
ncbi:Zn-dependent hydrolase/oxidoreductase family protein, putative [Trichophyton verrucosum HKI 0517]|uniref:Zn-dependent hydrolase/oxidoreductase family protein, putative n=1 Tax=Trichophyton verrucosum (strain HKI 0517) TaxID=663202 RepID=D4D928_TRIVH|nr:Zn-dependent hydrolase/oxidoreductase family protein, putative [Trichophyton verrucosum HKI 0517]EFE41676.1 Zn-dependent hydrolase/oxidoreductase family protein, putative [Trichophyton verrucosum HKI 0517]